MVTDCGLLSAASAPCMASILLLLLTDGLRIRRSGCATCRSRRRRGALSQQSCCRGTDTLQEARERALQNWSGQKQGWCARNNHQICIRGQNAESQLARPRKSLKVSRRICQTALLMNEPAKWLAGKAALPAFCADVSQFLSHRALHVDDSVRCSV